MAMPRSAELLTPAEAAVIADVTVRDVNRVIDEHIVPDMVLSLKGGRWIAADACAYVRFYFETAKVLTADERTRVIHLVYATKKSGPAVHHDFLTINFDRFVEATNARRAALSKARDRVVSDPDILGGIPVLKGTRIPVHDIAAAIAGSDDYARIKAAYPGLSDEEIDLAALYAKANPARGRPRSPRGGDHLTLISERRVARRRT